MQQLEFIIQGQILKRVDSIKLVENSRGYVKAHFALPSDYSGTISAYFKRLQDGVWVGSPVTVDRATGLCDIPDDILVDGKIYVGLQSTDTNIDIPTNAEMIDILPSGVPKELLPSPDGTVNDYQDFVLKHTEVVEKTAIVIDNATAAALSEAYAYDSEVNAKASEMAAKTSEDNSKASETNSASSASTATTKADIATTKASEALTSATNAATSATSAASSASTATAKASEASTSATNAATSATNAANTATEAITARTSTVKNKVFDSLDLRLEDIEYGSDTAIVDIKTGTSIQSTVADDYIAELKIEGATTVTKANPAFDISPDNVATIVSTINFNVTASNSDASKNNSINVTQELRKLPNGATDVIEKGTDGKWYSNPKTSVKNVNGTENWLLHATQPTNTSLARFSLVDSSVKFSSSLLCTHFKYNGVLNSGGTIEAEGIASHSATSQFNLIITKSRLSGWSDGLSNAEKQTLFKNYMAALNMKIIYELATPIPTVTSDVKLVSYKGSTTIYSTSNPQANITATFKSRLANAYSVLMAEITKIKQAIIALGGTV
jgi:hypothetical protein